MTTYESYYCNKEHASPEDCQEDVSILLKSEFFNLKKDIEMVDRFIAKIKNKEFSR